MDTCAHQGLLDVSFNDCVHLTTYSPSILRHLSAQLGCREVDVFSALCLARLNIGWAELAVLLRPWVGVLAESTLRSHVAPVLASAKRHKLVDQSRRFLFSDPLLPGVFSILDGVPVPTRGSAALYNGKHAMKYLTFQVFLSLDGGVLEWSVHGEDGTKHDSECLEGTPWLSQHRRDELVCADLAYISNRHALCQYKGALDERQELFDIVFRRLRTRVERFFGAIDKHRMFHYAVQSRETIDGLFCLVMNAEAVRWTMDSLNPYMLAQDEAQKSLWLQQPVCECRFEKLDNEHRQRKALNDFREELKEFVWNDRANIRMKSLPSAHAAKGTLPKPTKTKAQIRDSFKDRKAKTRELQKAEKRAKKSARKRAAKVPAV